MTGTKWIQVLVLISISFKFSYQQNITCKVPSDIVYVLDGSESLAENDFINMKLFVDQTLQRLEVEEQYARIGVIVFGTFPEEIIELNSTYNKALLSAKIVTIPHPKSGTGTARALERMRQMFTTNGRNGVKRVGVVITDGKSVSPTDTKNQSNLAKTEGIEMIAIGFGDNVFRPELQQIASSEALVFNSTDFNALLNSVVDALTGIVCQVITTTTTTTTTTPPPTTTTQLVTQKVSSDAWCPNCIIGRNWGFKSYPGDCTKFIEMFPDTDGTAIETIHSCPFGTFWNLRDITCDYSVKVDCADNPCKEKASGSVPMPGNCGGFWACVNGQSMASCCSKQFQKYINETLGCVDDQNCTDSCPPNDDNRIVGPQVCNSYPIENDTTSYRERVPGHGNITRSCPPGSAFEQDTCSCSKILDTLPSLPIQECKPDVRLNFDDNFHDVSAQSIAVGLENMMIESKQAVFGGNGMVNMWRFSNTDFKQKLAMSFEFQTSNTGDNQQALVTNCIFSDQEEATISIVADRQNPPRVIFKTETSNGTASVEVPYNDAINVMNKVVYIYDGSRLTGIVNNASVQAPLTGDIERRQSGIILGAGSKMGSFNGRMDDFQLFMCWPTQYLQYVTQ
ncbi:hypothetical protein FSP39_010705 [Pinctada imbricata]|uniref:VWFA domain-containing protein n=1 Tax=Pinctada imbricata TaxID=66713 RepID=A0AA88XYW5_PINIB|nr:hypothetical protein FSP39_010705 [Pinctada imbricata]